jgi:hypothetical protein
VTLTADHLRPPWPGEPTAAAYKDWLHVNVFDHASGAVGIVNASLHGAPDDPAARAVGTALFHVPDNGWVGDVTVRPLREARLGELSIGLDQVAIGVDTRSHLVAASVRMPAHGIVADLRGRPLRRPTVMDGTPVGDGWIGWYAVPRVALEGSLAVGPLTVDVPAASGYSDHNWGRWHWGGNVGWGWAAFLAPVPGPELVLSRITDRSHRTLGPAELHLGVGARTRRFPSAGVTVRWDAPSVLPSRRLPGAAAALHSDRAASRQPAGLELVADDGRDRVRLRFDTRAVAQIVLADPMRRGYSFLHELVGDFRCSGRLGGEAFEAIGLAVVERVE